MKRRVLGFNEVIAQLKAGNCILSAPMSDNDWIEIDGVSCTIRNDFSKKAHDAGLRFVSNYRKGSYIQEMRLEEVQ